MMQYTKGQLSKRLPIPAASCLIFTLIVMRVAGIMEEIENGVSGILLETTALGSLDDHM
jgi:hypothetical protein